MYYGHQAMLDETFLVSRNSFGVIENGGVTVTRFFWRDLRMEN
jgi:hypothetical protein